MSYKNLTIILKDGMYTVSHKNGESISFSCPPESFGDWVLRGRLEWFDEHGTMKGY